MTLRLVLASRSPARLALLRNAGFAPEAIVSGVDEEAYTAASPAELALTLAQAKARTVAQRTVAARAAAGRSEPAARSDAGTLVIGCDSVLDFEGDALGKPVDAEDAIRRWKSMRGREGVLVTGHCLIDTRDWEHVHLDSEDDARATLHEIAAVAATKVRFADLSDAEIEAYVATGEPLHVAGAFTLDGIGGQFVESIEGDPSNVIGLSLPLLRRMLGELGIAVNSLWTSAPKD